MKIIWLVNIVFPDVCKELGLPEPVTGGWLYSYKNALQEFYPQLKLYIISLYDGIEVKRFKYDNYTYIIIPSSLSQIRLNKIFSDINNEIKPDIVHIHGSEFYHSLAYVNACGSNNTVLSVQGLVSACALYYYGGIESKNINKFITFRDLIKKDTLRHQQKEFYKKGIYEIALIKKIKYIIGRTSWDASNCWSINPKTHYFKCEEALRDSFYVNCWDIKKCHRHSIFISQAYYPLKGLHKLLNALPLIVKQYPDVQVYIIGDDPTSKPKYKRTTYWNYLDSIINKLCIRSHLHFLGTLSEAEMVEQFLLAHVFVCPSAIENSSNSVCEAQLIGTPVVASYVGGMMDIVEDQKSGLLYRFEETAMLAYKICSVFKDDDLAYRLSINERAIALKRHDRESIANSLYNIYNEIIN